MSEESIAIADPNAVAPAAASVPASPVASAESWARELFGADGTINHKAFEKAPDDLKPLAKDWERFKKDEDFFKAYQQQKGLLGKKGLIEPLSEKATDAEKAEHMALLRKVNQVPEKPEGYGLQRPEGVPEGAWDQTYADSMAKLAHEEGVSPAALKKFAAAVVDNDKRAAEAQQQFEAKWFADQDKLIRDVAQKEGLEYGKAKEYAEKFGRRFGISPDNPIMKNASAFLAAARAGQAMGEDKLITGETRDFGVTANMGSAAAEKLVTSIMRDKNNPDYAAYYNHDKKQDPLRVEQVREKVKKLQAIAWRNPQ